MKASPECRSQIQTFIAQAARHHDDLLIHINTQAQHADWHTVEDLAQDVWLYVITRMNSGAAQAGGTDPESGLPACLASAAREVLGLQPTPALTDDNELLAAVLREHRVIDGPVPEQLLPVAA